MFDFTPEMMQEYEAEILVNIKGFDTTFSQMVYSRTSFHYTAIVWNAKFKPAFKRSDDGTETILELDKLNDFDILATPALPTIPT
jgi:inward rectifier potassium channel